MEEIESVKPCPIDGFSIQSMHRGLSENRRASSMENSFSVNGSRVHFQNFVTE